MNTAPAAATVTRFSTDTLPDGDRVAFVREVWGRAQRHIDITPLGEDAYRAHGRAWRLPGLHLACRTSSPVRTERTRAHLADGAEDMLVIVRDGAGTASQLGRELRLEPGEAVLISNADTGTTTFPEDSRIIVLTVPRTALGMSVRDGEEAFMRPMRHSAALHLLTGYVDMLEQDAPHDDETLDGADLQAAIATHIRDLMALTIGATRDAAEMARVGGVRAARLAAIRADIIANLSQVRLSARMMAERHHVCERTVYALFEDSGISFSAFVTEERLKRSLALLTDPAHRNRKICDIAFEVGFGDLSHFNRAFRRRYGDTPRNLRRGGRAAAPADADAPPRGYRNSVSTPV